MRLGVSMAEEEEEPLLNERHDSTLLRFRSFYSISQSLPHLNKERTVLKASRIDVLQFLILNPTHSWRIDIYEFNVNRPDSFAIPYDILFLDSGSALEFIYKPLFSLGVSVYL